MVALILDKLSVETSTIEATSVVALIVETQAIYASTVEAISVGL